MTAVYRLHRAFTQLGVSLSRHKLQQAGAPQIWIFVKGFTVIVKLVRISFHGKVARRLKGQAGLH